LGEAKTDLKKRDSTISMLRKVFDIKNQTIFINEGFDPDDILRLMEEHEGEPSDIYVGHETFSSFAGYFERSEFVKSRFFVSRIVGFREDYSFLGDRMTAVHLCGPKAFTLTQVLKNIDKLEKVTNHLILFEKPYTIAEVQPAINGIIQYSGKHLDKTIRMDQCVGLVVGAHTVPEDIEARIDVHPDGMVTFCPYFGKKYDPDEIHLKEFVNHLKICNSCSYLKLQ
jgi:hypothetical protein